MRRLADRWFVALTSKLDGAPAKARRSAAVLAAMGSMSVALAGCPIFDDHNDGMHGCRGMNCVENQQQPECTSTDQCGLNEVCGVDQQCHIGDCTQWGCASGECVVNDDLTATCGGNGSGGSGQGGAGQGGSGAAGGAGGAGAGGGSGGQGGAIDVTWCGNPDDCGASQTCAPDGTCQDGDCSTVGCIFGYACNAASGVCEPTSAAACGTDADCAAAGAGYACVSGLCTAPEDQCFDQGQCGANEKCAGGKCTDSCTTDAECSAAFACDTALGLCTTPKKACAITNDCGGPNEVCVDGACVPRSDMGACGADEAWVENGCIPDQAATFTCAIDGQQDVCAMGSLCLHHSCYISCEPPNQTACDNLPQLNLCKAVVSSSGAHQVCGSSSNLGNDCDPQSGASCGAGQICIDGYCK